MAFYFYTADKGAALAHGDGGRGLVGLRGLGGAGTTHRPFVLYSVGALLCRTLRRPAFLRYSRTVFLSSRPRTGAQV